MEDFIKYQRTIFYAMIIVCAAACAALFVMLPHDPQWGLGLALGSIAQLVKFKIVDVATVVKFSANIGMEQKHAAKWQFIGMIKTMVVLSIAFIVAYMYKPFINVWTLIAGILIPRLILVADGIIRPNPFGAKSVPSSAKPGEQTNEA